jgi:hypothetical protein
MIMGGKVRVTPAASAAAGNYDLLAVYYQIGNDFACIVVFYQCPGRYPYYQVFS